MTNFIMPNEIVVGYQNRKNDEESIKLGFATFNYKGKLRKEISWKGWIDSKLRVDKFDNELLSGFSVVGTSKRSTDWFGSGRHVVRIRDPRGFDLEITPENLLALMHHCSIENGYIKEKCIWIWSTGGKLALVPETSALYFDAQQFTKVNNETISMRDVEPGDVILTQNNEIVTYLGKFNFLQTKSTYIYGKFRQRTAVDDISSSYRYDVKSVSRVAYEVHNDDGTKSLVVKSALKPSKMITKNSESKTYFDKVKTIIDDKLSNNTDFTKSPYYDSNKDYKSIVGLNDMFAISKTKFKKGFIRYENAKHEIDIDKLQLKIQKSSVSYQLRNYFYNEKAKRYERIHLCYTDKYEKRLRIVHPELPMIDSSNQVIKYSCTLYNNTASFFYQTDCNNSRDDLARYDFDKRKQSILAYYIPETNESYEIVTIY